MAEPGENVGEPQIDAKLDYVKHHQLHDAIHRLTMMYTEDIFKIEAKLRQTHPTKEAFDLAIQSIKPQDYVKLEQLQDTSQQIIVKQTESMSKLEASLKKLETTTQYLDLTINSVRQQDYVKPQQLQKAVQQLTAVRTEDISKLEAKIKKLSTSNESLDLIVKSIKPQEIKEEPMKLFKCYMVNIISLPPYRSEKIPHWINLNTALYLGIADGVIRIDYGSNQILTIEKDHDPSSYEKLYKHLINRSVTLPEIIKDWPKYKSNINQVWIKVVSYNTDIIKLSSLAYIEIGRFNYNDNHHSTDCIKVAFNRAHFNGAYMSREVSQPFHTVCFGYSPSHTAMWDQLVSDFKKLCELMSE